MSLETEVDRRDLARAGLARLRPILMSAVIAILALSPLALGVGQGSALQKPLAIAIISGLLAGAPLVLFLLPAAYAVFTRSKSETEVEAHLHSDLDIAPDDA